MAGKWTKEQLAAIETTGCNLLVSAAAGAGKTAVLVERVIRLLCRSDNPVDIDRMLVVTFTEAAAAEMRERIASALEKEISVSYHLCQNSSPFKWLSFHAALFLPGGYPALLLPAGRRGSFLPGGR